MAQKLIMVCIEDNESMRTAVSDFLTTVYGIEVIQAADGRSGLEAAFRFAPHAILLDLMLPDLNGLEVCRRLRAHPVTARTPIIVSSVSPDLSTAQDALAAGANLYIPKTGFEPLIPAIEKLLNTKLTPGTTLSSANYTDIGHLHQKSPLEILTELGSHPRGEWAGLIARLLKDADANQRGRTVIALAAWQKEANAPFNKTEGQRFFWEHVRHSLASSTVADATAYWSRFALIALALMRPPDQINQTLEHCARNKNPDCRRWALRILTVNREPIAVELAVQALRDNNDDVRGAAVMALATLGGVEHIPVLTRTLSDATPGIREQAARALAQIASEMGTLALGTALLEGIPEAAEAAANGLALVASAEALDTLIRAAATRQEPAVLRQIAHALGAFKTTKSRMALIKLRQHPDEAVSRAAREYLGG